MLAATRLFTHQKEREVSLNQHTIGLLEALRVRVAATQTYSARGLFALLAVFVVLFSAGCSSPARGTFTSTLTLTLTPTLAPFVAEHGWTIVVPLGYVSPGVVTSGTSFVAEKPYQVEVVCEGSGNITITVSSPEADTQVYTCTPKQQTFSVMEYHPPIGQQVHVNVSAEPSVVWQGALETQQ